MAAMRWKVTLRPFLVGAQTHMALLGFDDPHECLTQDRSGFRGPRKTPAQFLPATFLPYTFRQCCVGNAFGPRSILYTVWIDHVCNPEREGAPF
jgi:hypothetical protein